MSSQRSRSPECFFVVLLAALVTDTLSHATRDVAVAEESDDVSRAELDIALHTLWTGRPEDQREAVEDADSWSGSLRTADPEDDDVRQAVEWLRTIVRAEKDDWIACRLLQNLLPLDSEKLGPLYRDAVRDPSPNVRWRAIQWFQDHKDTEATPLLEDLWSFEERPWARADLIEALAMNGSRKYVDDFLKIARGGDPLLAVAAIRALGNLHDERFIPDLAGVARGGSQAARAEAIEVLASWPDSEEALEAVLGAGSNGDRGNLLASLPFLKEFPSERAVRRLMELARAGADGDVQYQAVSALEELQPGGFADLLVDILHEPPSEAMSSLQSQAIWALHALDDPDVVPELSGLDPNLGGESFNNLRGLLADLSRDRTARPIGHSWIRTHCGTHVGGSEVVERNHAVVAPSEGLQTIRCWQYPEIPGDPEEFERIPAGSEVWIDDHFERAVNSWVRVSGDAADDCWILLGQLRPASSGSGTGAKAAKDPFRLEFDLSLVEFQSDGARTLRDADRLETIEPGDEVIGVALSLYPEDADTIPVLAAGYGDDGSLLDDEVVELLNALHDALPGQRDLIEFFRAHPELKRRTQNPLGVDSDQQEEDLVLTDE